MTHVSGVTLGTALSPRYMWGAYQQPHNTFGASYRRFFPSPGAHLLIKQVRAPFQPSDHLSNLGETASDASHFGSILMGLSGRDGLEHSFPRGSTRSFQRVEQQGVTSDSFEEWLPGEIGLSALSPRLLPTYLSWLLFNSALHSIS